MATATRSKSTRARPARRTVRRAARSAAHAPAQAQNWFFTETGQLVAWGLAGFAGVLAIAGVAAVLVENGTIELPDRDDVEARLKAIQNSKTPREALSWISNQIADLRSEFQTQIARLS